NICCLEAFEKLLLLVLFFLIIYAGFWVQKSPILRESGILCLSNQSQFFYGSAAGWQPGVFLICFLIVIAQLFYLHY
ncbi:MAG: hypothetical protein K2I56_04035, partial [Muribaculaceae bacterium]|nr:hypothetical protein [Muribaculaceae bacterium]